LLHLDPDELRLIFTCCHPALTPDARIALTLREVGGLTTEEIARAYLAPAPTIAQRIVRAKAKIRDEAIPYEVPARAELPARLESALQVVYLIFNEGYAATEGPSLTRDDLCAEAIRLGRLLVQLMAEPEAIGLLALMLLHEARRAARVDAAGDLILLEHQNRSLWDRERIAELRAWSSAPSNRDALGRICSRRPSRRCTSRRRALRKRIGRKSSRSTTRLVALTLRRSWP
jgi:RNA polymerase sigma-70 factor, ECF subfamily